MKRKSLTAAFSFFLILILTGCSCAHEWTDADCINPAVCTKCGETGDLALGHQWADATCSTPQICTHCGETQGMPLSHEYEDWIYTDTEMVRTCVLCAAEERAEIDRQAHLNSLLKGHWDYYGVKTMGKLKTGYYLPWFTYAEYDRRENIHLVMGSTSQNLTVESGNYDPDTNSYSGYFLTESGKQSSYVLEIGEYCNLLRTNANSGMEVIYCQYNTDHEDLLGTWSVTYDGKLYYFTLNQDRTFTGNLSEEVSGQWLMLPDEDCGGFGIGGCLMFYEHNGEMITTTGSTIVFGSSPGMAEIDSYASLDMKPTPDSEALSFRKVTADELNTMRTALEEAPSKIIGTWDSTIIHEWDGKNRTPRIFLDHPLTVREDGTFTLSLDQQITGTWTVHSTDVTNEAVAYYYYKFHYPTAEDSEGATYNSLHNTISFSYRDKQGFVQSISFTNLTEEKREQLLKGPELLPGEYVSEKTVYYDSSIKQDVETEATGYTLSIFEDGTYTVELDETVSDQWFFSNLYTDNGHTYAFRHKGSQYESQRLEDGTVIFNCRINGKYMSIYFLPK